CMYALPKFVFANGAVAEARVAFTSTGSKIVVSVNCADALLTKNNKERKAMLFIIKRLKNESNAGASLKF
ncbi:MAG: hypothetical protein V4676_03350, partial [Bacteroidota bacterium]